MDHRDIDASWQTYPVRAPNMILMDWPEAGNVEVGREGLEVEVDEDAVHVRIGLSVDGPGQAGQHHHGRTPVVVGAGGCEKAGNLFLLNFCA